jgi:hypothetical protein
MPASQLPHRFKYSCEQSQPTASSTFHQLTLHFSQFEGHLLHSLTQFLISLRITMSAFERMPDTSVHQSLSIDEGQEFAPSKDVMTQMWNMGLMPTEIPEHPKADEIRRQVGRPH